MPKTPGLSALTIAPLASDIIALEDVGWLLALSDAGEQRYLPIDDLALTGDALEPPVDIGPFHFTVRPDADAPYHGANFTVDGQPAFGAKSYYLGHYQSGWELIFLPGTDTNAHIFEIAVPQIFSIRSSGGAIGAPLFAIRDNHDSIDFDIRMSREVGQFHGADIWVGNAEGGDFTVGPLVVGLETLGMRFGTAFDSGGGLYGRKWEFYIPGGTDLPYFVEGVMAGAVGNGRVMVAQGDATLPGTVTFFKPDGTSIGRIGNSQNFLSIETMGGAPVFIDGGYLGVIGNPFLSFSPTVTESARVLHDGTFGYFRTGNNGGGHSGVKLINDEDKGITIAATSGNVTFDGGITPASMADGSAANGTIYFSTTANKLVYKDAGGVVNALY